MIHHTFATRLYHKTGDLCLVESALGHRQIAPTEVYARVSDEALRVATHGAERSASRAVFVFFHRR